MEAVADFERVLLCDEKKIQRGFGLKGWPHLLVLDPETEEVIVEIKCGKLKSPLAGEKDFDGLVLEVREARKKAGERMAEGPKAEPEPEGQPPAVGPEGKK